MNLSQLADERLLLGSFNPQRSVARASCHGGLHRNCSTAPPCRQSRRCPARESHEIRLPHFGLKQAFRLFGCRTSTCLPQSVAPPATQTTGWPTGKQQPNVHCAVEDLASANIGGR